MIDVPAILRGFATRVASGIEAARLLRWSDEWYSPAGCDVPAGLLDTGFDEQMPDLAGAQLSVRDFTGCGEGGALLQHGSHSIALLAGQGRYKIRGIAPRARLFVARVVGRNGVAAPRAVEEALDWVVACGARVVALPLGEPVERRQIARQIQEISKRGVAVFAAAGNCHPDPLLFPARHRLAIAVGAADRRGNLLRECSRLPRLDVVAPGLQIPALIGGRSVRRRSGTSVACVLAAGVAVAAISAGAVPGQSTSRESVLNAVRIRIGESRSDADGSTTRES